MHTSAYRRAFSGPTTKDLNKSVDHQYSSSKCKRFKVESERKLWIGGVAKMVPVGLNAGVMIMFGGVKSVLVVVSEGGVSCTSAADHSTLS